MLEGLGLRAVRDALPGNPIAQEHIAGATLTAMAIADVSIQSFPSARFRSAYVNPLAMTKLKLCLFTTLKSMLTTLFPLRIRDRLRSKLTNAYEVIRSSKTFL